MIDQSTLKQLLELINLLNTPKEQTEFHSSSSYIGKYVIIRTYSAGVHFGVLVRHEGKEVELKDAKRIWSWYGANTLHEISIRGVGSKSKISESIKSIVLTEAIEIIPCQENAILNLCGANWQT